MRAVGHRTGSRGSGHGTEPVRAQRTRFGFTVQRWAVPRTLAGPSRRDADPASRCHSPSRCPGSSRRRRSPRPQRAHGPAPSPAGARAAGTPRPEPPGAGAGSAQPRSRHGAAPGRAPPRGTGCPRPAPGHRSWAGPRGLGQGPGTEPAPRRGRPLPPRDVQPRPAGPRPKPRPPSSPAHPGPPAAAPAGGSRAALVERRWQTGEPALVPAVAPRSVRRDPGTGLQQARWAAQLEAGVTQSDSTKVQFFNYRNRLPAILLNYQSFNCRKPTFGNVHALLNDAARLFREDRKTLRTSSLHSTILVYINEVQIRN